MPRSPSAALRYAERTVLCRAPAPEIAWLEEFLSPWFVSSAFAKPTCSVELKIDDTESRELLECTAASGGQMIDVFGMDGGMEQLPFFESVDGEQIALDEGLGVHYRVGQQPSDVEIISPDANRKVRIALMRVVREFAMSEIRAMGAMLVHGAVMAVQERGIMIAGPKQAGKTTLLLHGLRAGGEFVSNDRGVVRNYGRQLQALGMPTVVSIRQATLDVLPELDARLATGRYDHISTLAEIESGEAPLRPRRGRPRNLSAAQLCAVLDAPVRREVLLDTLVLLRTSQRPGVNTRELSASEARVRLDSCRFGTAERSSELFAAPRTAESETSLDSSDVVGRLRCIDFELGIGTSGAEITDGFQRALA